MEKQDNKNRKDIVASFNDAMYGLLFIIKKERNFRIHLLMGFMVIAGALLLNIPLPEFLILLIAIGTVFSAEIINTAVEIVVDGFTDKYHAEAKKAKDVAASAVFISSVSAFVI